MLIVIPERAKHEPGISRFRVWSFGPSRNDQEKNYAGVMGQSRRAAIGGLGRFRAGAGPGSAAHRADPDQGIDRDDRGSRGHALDPLLLRPLCGESSLAWP